MERVMLCAPDWVQGTDTTSALIGGGSWDATQNAAKVATDDVNDQAISTDCTLASTQMYFDFQVPRDARAAIITDHNIDNFGLVRWRGSNTNAWAGATVTMVWSGGTAGQEWGGYGYIQGGILTGAAISIFEGQLIKFSGHDTIYKVLFNDTELDPVDFPYFTQYIEPALTHDVAIGETITTICGDFSEEEAVYNSGWFDGVPMTYDYGDVFYGHPSYYSLKPTAEDRALYTIPAVKTFNPVLAQYWHLEIDNTANPAGVIRIARVVIARGNQPTINLAPGATSIGWLSNTKVSVTNSGRRLYRKKRAQRNVPCLIKDLPRQEAFATFFDLQGTLDLNKQFYFIFDPSDTSLMHRRSFLATFEALNPIQFPYAFGGNDVPLNILEVI